MQSFFKNMKNNWNPRKWVIVQRVRRKMPIKILILNVMANECGQLLFFHHLFFLSLAGLSSFYTRIFDLFLTNALQEDLQKKSVKFVFFSREFIGKFQSFRIDRSNKKNIFLIFQWIIIAIGLLNLTNIFKISFRERQKLEKHSFVFQLITFFQCRFSFDTS